LPNDNIAIPVAYMFLPDRRTLNRGNALAGRTGDAVMTLRSKLRPKLLGLLLRGNLFITWLSQKSFAARRD
jgi:hypothetical protein